MIVRTYGLYDGVSKEVVNTFASNNDESAVRYCEITLKNPKTDRSQAKDFILMYLYSFDSASGSVIDNDKKEIIALASIMPEKVEIDSAEADELRDVVKGLNSRIEQLDTKFKSLSSALESLSIPIKALDPALSQVHPYIDSKKGKIIWQVRK